MVLTCDYRTDLGALLRSVSFYFHLHNENDRLEPSWEWLPPRLQDAYQSETKGCRYQIIYRRIWVWIAPETYIDPVIPEPDWIPELIAWWESRNATKIELVGESIPKATTELLLR
jgi:hypothetical protein